MRRKESIHDLDTVQQRRAYDIPHQSTVRIEENEEVVILRYGRVTIKTPPRWNTACVVSPDEIIVKKGAYYLVISIPGLRIKAHCMRIDRGREKPEYHLMLNFLD